MAIWLLAVVVLFWPGAPAFAQGDPAFFMEPEVAIDGEGLYLNDPTTTRDRANEVSGVLVMCWGQNRTVENANRAYYRIYDLKKE